MVIYEVNLSIQNEIYPAYLLWLREHIKQILQFDGFIKADMGIVQSQENTEQTALRVSYLLDSYESLQRYLQEQAPIMRAEALKKFGDQFNAARRIILDLEEILE